MFSLEFLGAAGQVTGSKYFLRTSKHRGTMVDCGLFQGPRTLTQMNWNPPPIQISDVHNIILTHAHLDHTGYLPKLRQLGFNGEIHCTPATREVTEFILRDSAHLQMQDAKHANKHGYSRHKPALALYTPENVEETLALIREQPRHKVKILPDNLGFEYFNAGHILGSCFVRVEKRFDIGEPVSVLFSGDVGREHPVYLIPRETPPAADYLVCESTYGDRLHPTVDAIAEFGEIVKESIERSAVLVVPAFAVDRAQELIFALNRLMREGAIPEIQTYVDSPMATGVTALYEKYSEDHLLSKDELAEPDKNPLSFPTLKFVQTPAESKLLNHLVGPAIIISASGMASGGRIVYHLLNRLPNPNNIILFTGFQAEATLGRELIEGATSVLIQGERVEVKAQVRQLTSMSGHADQGELLRWMKSMPNPPRKVFLTHGEDGPRGVLKQKIEQELGWTVEMPTLGQIVEFASYS